MNPLGFVSYDSIIEVGVAHYDRKYATNPTGTSAAEMFRISAKNSIIKRIVSLM